MGLRRLSKPRLSRCYEALLFVIGYSGIVEVVPSTMQWAPRVMVDESDKFGI